MNDSTYTDSAPPPETLDEEALRKRLVNRIAIAGVVIVALLGGLAVIDSLYVASPTATPKIAVPPVPIETAKPVEAIALSATAADTAPEPPQPEAVPSIKSQVEPEESSSPSVPLRNESKPPAKVAEPKHMEAKPESKPSAHAAPPRPLTQARPTIQAEPRFVLQVGVFNNIDNAQELFAKLQKNGIPALIEARVQVGPFKTKTEADEARTKLKAMGLDAGLLMATHR